APRRTTRLRRATAHSAARRPPAIVASRRTRRSSLQGIPSRSFDSPKIAAGRIYSMAHRARTRRRVRARPPPALWPIPGGGRRPPGLSALTARTVEGRALLLAERAHRCAAGPTRLACAAVHETGRLVAACGAVARYEVAKRAAAAFDRLVQRLAKRRCEPLVARQRDAPCGGRRTYSSTEQALGGVDVPD